MKKWMLGLGLLLIAVRLAAETEFIKTLPADEFAAAGLAKLTPAELARLEAAVMRFKTGEVAVVQQAAEAKVAAVKQEAETKVAAAEAKAKEADTVSVPGDKKKPSWFTALLTLKRAGEDSAKAEPLEGVLVGDFRGFTGSTVFTLEDGSRWVQQNRSETLIFSPAVRDPRVKVFPASIAGFWLEIEGVGTRVRVLPFEQRRTR